MRGRHLLRDGGLGALALAVAVGAVWTVVRPPAAPVAISSTGTAPTASPSVAPDVTSSATPVPVPAPSASSQVTAAVVRADATADAHLVEAARLLGWQLVPVPLGDAPPAVPVVLVQVAYDGLVRTLEVIRQVPDSNPDARLVVLAPLRSELSADDLALVTAAVKTAGGELLRPATLGWTAADGTFDADGGLSADGAARIGALLAERLRQPST